MRENDIMKIGIFTGTISLHKENPDVRKLYVLERLKYLTKSQIQFEIVTPQVDRSALYGFSNIEYNTYKCINRKHLKMISAIVYSSNKLKNLNCNLMHCYTHQAAMLAWLVNCFRKQKYIIVFEPMGLAYEESKLDKKSSIKVRLIRPFIKFEERFIFRRSDVIVVYTDILKKYISKKFDISLEKIYIIPHGVNLKIPHLEDELDKSYVLNKLNISEKNKIVLYAGSISELHGTPCLMESIDYLSKKRNDISFLILGRGALENNLISWIKENKLTNIHLLGFIPSEIINLYFNLADILLIPHAKCMQTELDPPTKLFEYLASGKPIVSFNLKAIAEVVDGNAILVEPDNPKAFADGILMLVDDERLREILGAEGKVIAKKYSWEISAKKQYELYTELYNKYVKK